MIRANAAAILRAFKDAGIDFIAENGGALGVRLRTPTREGAIG
jgi:hypothetical protein